MSVSVTGITTLTGTTTIGVVTGGTSVSATHFYGDGAALAGIDATSLKDSGNIKAQANPNGAVVTGVATEKPLVVLVVMSLSVVH